jgi:hypothetical protein
MFDALTRINWIAILAATLASFVLGALWFRVMFGRAYAAALGREYDPKVKPAPIFIVGPLVCTLITTVTSATLMKALSISSTSDAVMFGVIVGLGYFVSTMTNTAINPNMPRPLMYSLVSGPFFFIGSIITSLILATIE